MENPGAEEVDLPLVSIIIASYQAALTLPGCLESIAAQSYGNREVIIIDGASTDGTVQILAERDDQISSWVSEPDRGIYHAWNKGLDRAAGEWICFLGADDRFADATSLSQLTEQASKDTDLVCARAAWVDSLGKITETWGDPWNWERMKRYQTVVHSGMLHRAALFSRHGKFSETYKIAGDYEFLLRLGGETNAAFLDKVVVLLGKSGISHKMFREAFRERKAIQRAHGEIGSLMPWAIFVLSHMKARISGIRERACEGKGLPDRGGSRERTLKG